MPEKPLTIAAYAASASLAAAALVYVFGPTFILDGSDHLSSSKKNGVVGLANPANDCFVNSVLQGLAGLGDLRAYLIRELHRRHLDGEEVYRPPIEGDKLDKKKIKKMTDLEVGIVTQALKQMLDGLNERPLHKKTISANGFVMVLQQAFQATISRQQQDAQEFLQIVTERLCEEYHAGCNARKRARQTGVREEDGSPVLVSVGEGQMPSEPTIAIIDAPEEDEDADLEKEDGFPFEGTTESQIQCQYCGYRAKPNVNTFTMLTLPIPDKESTTLNECLDGYFKTEEIEDFKCAKCLLDVAIQSRSMRLKRTSSPEARSEIQTEISKLQKALDDPESPPDDVELPQSKDAPKRKISRYVTLAHLPKVAAIHLSRSYISSGGFATKNEAKVAFPEELSLGPFLLQQKYRLSAIITHRGTHNAGHYETFRRQAIATPYATPHPLANTGPYSNAPSRDISQRPSPRIRPVNSESLRSPTHTLPDDILDLSPAPKGSPLYSPSQFSIPPRDSSSTSLYPGSSIKNPSVSTLDIGSPATSTLDSPAIKPEDVKKKLQHRHSHRHRHHFGKKKAKAKKWWRISDETATEVKMSEVLAMQQGVYLLFYELEKDMVV